MSKAGAAAVQGLAAVSLVLACGQLRAQWRGPSPGGLVFLAAPPPPGHAAAVEPQATQRQPERASAGFAAGAAATAVAALAAVGVLGLRAAAGHRSQGRTQRRATTGTFWRDYPEYHKKYANPQPYPSKRLFIPGEWGYSTMTRGRPDLPNPARQALSQINQPMATFVPSQFYLEPFAKPDGVKEVGSCVGASKESKDVVVPANPPAYVRPKIGIRLEKEPGPKRPPLDTEGYEKYVQKKCHLTASAQATAGKNGFSLEKDFICDRASLTLLLRYLSDTMTPKLRSQGQSMNPLDFVKISKGPNGKALILECIFEQKNLWCEFRPYRGAWKRSEVSNKGYYMPAWQRLATGDSTTKTLMITGLRQIAGSVAGVMPNFFRFVEYELGGLKFLTRTVTHATSDGKNVELKHKNWYYVAQTTALETYYNMLLGGVDLLAMGIHRSGKLVQIFETTLPEVIEKHPKVVEAAERRMGRLVALLKQVKETLEKASDEGPWVLQWQNGELVLGKYEKVEEEEEAEQKEEEVNVVPV